MSHYPPVPLAPIAKHFNGVIQQADGSFAVWCPLCACDCVSITDTGKGAARIYCPNCKEGEIIQRVGLTPGDLIVFDEPPSYESVLAIPMASPRPRPNGTTTSIVADQIPLVPVKPDALPFPSTPLDHYIDALVDRTQAPRVLCAQSILAAVTLAVQHLADIEIPGIGGGAARRPISSFYLTIARSGERKSAADRIALEGVERRRRELERAHALDVERYKMELRAYESVKERGGEQGAPPIEPPRPTLLVKEPTQEGIFRSLKEGQLSQGLFNDEAGSFLGGYGMSKDNKMRTCATLNSLWDGSTLDRVRAKEQETLRGRRFCIHLMMQPQASEQLVSDAMLRDLGFTARCLAAEPESTIGARPFREPDAASIQACDDLAIRLERALEITSPTDEMGLALRVLPLDEEARLYWIHFHDVIEERLSGSYRSIQGFASKAPEHALRLAAVMALFRDHRTSSITVEGMCQGIELACFYLAEQLRLEVGRPSERDEAAELLLQWLRERNLEITSIPDICRNGPSMLRKRDAAQEALETCVEAGWLVESGAEEINGIKRRKTWTVVKDDSADEGLQ